MFYKKELQKTSPTEFRIGKAIKKNCYKRYVKWNVYDKSFNRWIDKKYILSHKKVKHCEHNTVFEQ